MRLFRAAVAVTILLSAGATQAAQVPYVQWQPLNNGGLPAAWSNAPSYTAAGITGSNLTSNVSYDLQANGYTLGGDTWSTHGSIVSSAIFDLSMTTASAAQVTYFSFVAYNNDCENNGNINYSCTGATFDVKMKINNGSYTDLGATTYQTPYSINQTVYTLNQSLNAGDTIAFELIGQGSVQIPTGQYMIAAQTIGTTVVDTPEPATLALLGAGLTALGALRRRRR